MFQSTHPHGVRPFLYAKQYLHPCVSIHAPTRGATAISPEDIRLIAVSIHAPTRGATGISVCKQQTQWFQSTHPHGVRQYCIAYIPDRNGFNPRTHTGCDRRGDQTLPRYTCFNPRTHTGCDVVGPSGGISHKVSIHAPTRGATLVNLAYQLQDAVSIHAPTRGATELTTEFNVSEEVSIHAPTRGATYREINVVKAFAFQSTHPHGVRLRQPGNRINCKLRFNPRTHTGCDCSAEEDYQSRSVSIHAPTRGATVHLSIS